MAKSRGVNLVFHNSDDFQVMGYEIRLEQVWVNLLDNAIKFNRPDGEVRVEMLRETDRAIVRVHDTGLGIPSRDLPRIFERFYRVDKARSRATGGTGLGFGHRQTCRGADGRIGCGGEPAWTRNRFYGDAPAAKRF